MDNKESKDVPDLTSLSKEELELMKLRKEVYLLEEQIKDRAPKSTRFLDKILRYLQNNIGKILAVATLIGTLVIPVLNFFGTQRKAHLLTVSSDMFRLLDTAKVDPTKVEQISTQDPKIVAPYLLNLLSEQKIDRRTAEDIYIRMYTLNKDLSSNTLSDKFLFLFIKDNKAILENELRNSARDVFNKKLPDNSEDTLPLLIKETYIDIIYGLNLESKRDFIKTLKILRDKYDSDSALYNDIHEYLVIKSNK